MIWMGKVQPILAKDCGRLAKMLKTTEDPCAIIQKARDQS
jgi:hypothetical protein